MRRYLERLPQETQDLIKIASHLSAKMHMPAYLVGGFVRDLLLGVNNLDLDIVVEGDAIKLSQELKNRLSATQIVVHQRFGTSTLNIKPQQKIDLATARKETYPQPASLPLVRPGTLKDDLKRRDFTINAMALSINEKDFGRLIDYFGGRRDLKGKKIRILHHLSFIDDPTRILRAVRFAARFNFKIHPQTLKLLKKARKLKMLQQLQPQRLRDEIILILKEAHLIEVICQLKELTGLNFLHPHLTLGQNTLKLLRALENQIRWFCQNYPRHRMLDNWLIYLSGLLDELSLAEVKAVLSCFVFSRGQEKRIIAAKNSSKIIAKLSRKSIKPDEIFNLLEPLSYETILFIRAKAQNRRVQLYVDNFFEIYHGMRLCVSGDDLHKLGLMPGPYYAKIFAKVLKAKLNCQVQSREEELAFIRALLKKR